MMRVLVGSIKRCRQLGERQLSGCSQVSLVKSGPGWQVFMEC